jgi:hypothetical protein
MDDGPIFMMLFLVVFSLYMFVMYVFDVDVLECIHLDGFFMYIQLIL